MIISAKLFSKLLAIGVIFHIFFYAYLMYGGYPIDIAVSYLDFSIEGNYDINEDGALFYIKEIVSWGIIHLFNLFANNIKILSYILFVIQLILLPILIKRYGAIVLIWFCLPFLYYLNFNALRQGLALTFILLSLSVESKFKRFIFAVLAFLSHNSSLIFIIRILPIANLWKSIILGVASLIYWYYLGAEIDYTAKNYFAQMLLLTLIFSMYLNGKDLVAFFLCINSFYLTDLSRLLYFPMFFIYRRSRRFKLEDSDILHIVFIIISIGSIYFTFLSLGIL